MTDELKPCLRCSSSDVDYLPYFFQNSWAVGCKICGTQTKIFSNKMDTLFYWNHRPVEDALRARVAELEAADRWIPVGERLPEADTDVIIVTKNSPQNDDGTACFARVYRFHDGKFFGWGLHDKAVTHWRPLPKPPKE